MISAHARAGFILGDATAVDSAANAAQFILKHLFIQKRLFRSYKDNTARYNAYLDDYAFFIASLLDLYEATHDMTWIEKAMELDAIYDEQRS